MDRFFSFRLDDVINDKLRTLAKQTYRSRGAVLRLLILSADMNSDLVIPNRYEHDLSSPTERKSSQPVESEND